jgi:hypothetical protein
MNNSLLQLYVIIGILFAFVSCSKSIDRKQTIEDRIYNFQQSGWKSRKINQYANDINYMATEVPLEYYLLKSNQNYNKVDSLLQIMSDERILEFEFQHADQEDLLLEAYTNKSYDEAVKYMSFVIQKDFKLVTSMNDTITCSGAHFERNYKVAPFKRILLYFDGIPTDENIQLVYEDHLFGNGVFAYKFKESPLKL